MIDTPDKSYWYGYMMLGSYTEQDETTVVSKERFHLDSLLTIYPDGDLATFEVETGKYKNDAYFTFTVKYVDQNPLRPVRKLARHVIRGMMDSRPASRWTSDSIDIEFPPHMAEYIIEYMPYLRVEYLNNGKVRLYTCTVFDTKRALEYLYKNAPVAKTSRKSLYDNMHQKQ